MSPTIRRRLLILGALAGATVAILGGFTEVSCASTRAIVVTLAGSFGAGAAFHAAVAELRRAPEAATRPPPTG